MDRRSMSNEVNYAFDAGDYLYSLGVLTWAKVAVLNQSLNTAA